MHRWAYPENMLVIKTLLLCCATIHALSLGNICSHESNAIKGYDGCSALKPGMSWGWKPTVLSPAAEEPICHPLPAAGLPPCTPYLYTCYAKQLFAELGRWALSAAWSLRLFLRYGIRKQVQICEWSLIFQARGQKGFIWRQVCCF